MSRGSVTDPVERRECVVSSSKKLSYNIADVYDFLKCCRMT